MGKARKKATWALALVLAALLALAAAPSALAEEAEGGLLDIGGHWAQAEILRWRGYGVIAGDSGSDGKPNGMFRPDDGITRGEFAKIVNTIFGYQKSATPGTFSDLSGKWYADSILKLAEAGVLNGSDGKALGDDGITREQTFAILRRLFAIPENSGGLSRFADAGDTSSWAVAEVGGMAAAGFVNGDGGRLNPTAPITRAEAVKLIDNVIKGYYNAPGAYDGGADGIAVAYVPGVMLRGADIGGSLYITPGVGEGDFTLESGTVSGAAYVLGGGESSVFFGEGAKVSGGIAVKTGKPGASGTRVVIASPSVTGKVTVEEGSGPAIIEGELPSLDIQGGSVTIGADAKITTVTVSGDGVSLSVSRGASVATLNASGDGAAVTVNSGATVTTVNVSGENFTVKGAGKVATVNVSEGVTTVTRVETAATKVNNDGSADVVGANGKVVAEPGKDGTTQGAASGSGSSSGGGGGGGTATTYYTVTFSAASIGRTDTVQVASGATVTASRFPAWTRSGYTLDGWNTASDGTGSDFTASTAVTRDITVYAKWKLAGSGTSTSSASFTYNSVGGMTPLSSGETGGDDSAAVTTVAFALAFTAVVAVPAAACVWKKALPRR